MSGHVERSGSPAKPPPDPLHRRLPAGQAWLLRGLPAHRRGDRPLAGDERLRTAARHAGDPAGSQTVVMESVARALLPLSAPPTGPGWNHADMSDLLGNRARQAAAVLVGIREGVQPRLVLTVRTDQLQMHAGQVAFPGGRSDPADGDALTTALRESEEEIGLDRALVTPLGYLDRFETISGFCITPVVAKIAAEAQLYPAPDEVAEVFEVPLSFLLEPANLRRYTMEFRGHQRPMVEFVHGGHRIWGATAAMLFNLLQRMG